jgi:DNA-binding NarL/FixJ family response regulator
VYDRANYLLNKHSGFYAVLSAGMLLAQCAIWKGDIVMWRRAKHHIAQAPAQNDDDLDMMQLAISAVDIMIYSADSFPQWFTMGCFEPVHPDAFPAAKVYYAKYLYACAYGIATGVYHMDGMQGLSMMRMVPNMVEPLICWAKVNNTVMSEIYLRMTCAAAYHNCGNDDRAILHIDRALTLALQDKLYGTIAEYCRVLDNLVQQRLSVLDPQAYAEVDRLYRMYNQGWSKLSGAVRGKNIITTLSAKEREVAKLAAFGMSNQQIADKMHLSLSVVKQAIRVVSEKSGMARADFAAIL